MMQEESYHYERTDTSKTPNYSDKSKLDQCIDSIIRKEGYISCDVQKKPISTDGGNYLGNLYEVNIKGKTPDGEKETPVFIKAMTPDAVEMEVISLNDIYAKELFMYTELGNVFNELQDEANVPIKERFKIVKNYDESNPKAIILENITKRGFKTWYRMDCVTLDMAEACIKQLAKFHGLSFVIKDRRTEYFENKIKSLEQPFIFDKGWETFKIKALKNTLQFLDEDMKRRIEDKITGVLQKYAHYMLKEDSRCCVCHGDYRLNNIMVKEMEGKVDDVLAVDFQFIHYGCPVLDFFYFMYTGSDFEFRKKHMSYLKDLYFETLRKFLLYFNMHSESVYSRKSFEKEFELKRDYGLIISVLCLPFVFALEGQVTDLSKEAISDFECTLDDKFKDRFVGAIQEFIDLGYF